MKTRTKVWLSIAACLVLLGCILFVGVMTTLGWDFTKLATVKYETNTYEISEEIENISINADTADIVFALSDDGKCTVVCHEEEKVKHSVTVTDGILTVECVDERTLRDFIGYIGLNFDRPEITVYLPQTEYASLFVKESTGDIRIPKDFSFGDADISLSTGDVSFDASVADTLKIKTSTGDIRVENISAGILDLSVSTGDVYLADIACKKLTSQGNTGDITLKNVIATERFSIERDTGNVKLEKSDAAEIFIETDAGNVTGTLLSDKKFIVETDTGHVSVPKTETGGKCEIITDTGDIRISLVQ
jgi:hypothetical protein